MDWLLIFNIRKRKKMGELQLIKEDGVPIKINLVVGIKGETSSKF
jgi:hypothetical protein